MVKSRFETLIQIQGEGCYFGKITRVLRHLRVKVNSWVRGGAQSRGILPPRILRLSVQPSCDGLNYHSILHEPELSVCYSTS